MPVYPFTAAELERASDEWGCNCGPSALAFALQMRLDQVRPLIPDFESKRYTSPGMMKSALELVARPYDQVRRPTVETMFAPRIALTRIQWSGPWTMPYAPPKWAYRQTHWIATWSERGVPLVFDCNGGIRGFGGWETEVVPEILATVPRNDGGWRPTHVWRIAPL